MLTLFLDHAHNVLYVRQKSIGLQAHRMLHQHVVGISKDSREIGVRINQANVLYIDVMGTSTKLVA